MCKCRHNLGTWVLLISRIREYGYFLATDGSLVPRMRAATRMGSLALNRVGINPNVFS